MELWILALILLAAGMLAGFLSTLYGIGGGIIMVPVMHYGLGVDFRLATAISLVVITMQSPVGVYQHLRRGAVSWGLALPMVGAGVVGVVAGILLQPRIPVPALRLLLATLMLMAASRMVLTHVKPRTERQGLPVLLGLGAVAGAASRLLGIGGGLLTVPVLALLGVPMHRAVGSSLVPVFTNAALASAVAIASGLDVKMAIPLALGALVAAPLGAKAAHALPDRGLRHLFAAALGVVALYIVVTAARGA